MTVRDIEVAGRRVLLRVDFNVPVDINTGEITDDSRIRAALSTIEYLMAHNARIILMSHFGRPKGKVVDELRLAPVARRLSRILGQEVKTLVEGPKEPGFYTVTWNGQDNSDRPVASGVYYYRLRANDEVLTKRLVFMK